MKIIRECIEPLKNWPDRVAAELNGTRAEPRSRKLSARLGALDYDACREELIAAFDQEVDAEWTQTLLAQARHAKSSLIEVDATGPDTSGVGTQTAEAFVQQLDGFENPIVIASPTALTILQSYACGFYRKPYPDHKSRRLTNLFRVGYLLGAPVYVDQYASDCSANLVCDEGWFEVDAGYVIDRQPIEPGTPAYEEYNIVAAFKTDVQFKVDPTKIRGVSFKCITIGFF